MTQSDHSGASDPRAQVSRRRWLLGAGACTSGLLGNCRPSPKPAQPVSELWIGGDVHLGESGADRLSGVASLLGDAFGLVNLEGPVSSEEQATIAERREPASVGAATVRLINSSTALATLRNAGVGAVGLANNHALDLGKEGLSATQVAVEELGFAAIGADTHAKVIMIAGVRIALTAHDLSNGLPPDLPAELGEARERADQLVATFHVTGPPSYLPPPELREAIAIALAAGASAVAAHGSHALAAVERRGDAVIAWGLGNLVFSCDCTDEIDGAILRLGFEGRTVRAQIVPIDAGLHGAPARKSHDPELVYDLLSAIGSSPLKRDGVGAWF